MLRGSINSKKYTGIIKEGVYPTIFEVSQTFPQAIFHDDNAPLLNGACGKFKLISIAKFTYPWTWALINQSEIINFITLG